MAHLGRSYARSRRFGAIASEPAAAAPAFVPALSSRRAVRLVRLPRGRAQLFLEPQPQPQPFLRARVRAAPPYLWREKLAEPPWPQEAPPAPPAYPPFVVAFRRRFGFPHRGRLALPPWPQEAPPAAPVWPPSLITRRRALAMQQRGRRRSDPVPAQVFALPLLGAKRRVLVLVRRPRPLLPTPAQAWAPSGARARPLRVLRRLARHMRWAITAAEVEFIIVTGRYDPPQPAGLMTSAPDEADFDPPAPGGRVS